MHQLFRDPKDPSASIFESAYDAFPFYCIQNHLNQSHASLKQTSTSQFNN